MIKASKYLPILDFTSLRPVSGDQLETTQVQLGADL